MKMKRNLRSIFGFGALLCGITLSIFAISASAQQPQQILTKHVPSEIYGPTATSPSAKLVGPLSLTQQMHLGIMLPARNQAELISLLQRLYDPTSPDYRKFLSVDQFTAQFGPTPEDYQAVIDFARANGLTVTKTHANRLLLDVSGSVDQVNRAFNVTMKTYQHPTENRTFFSPDREPTV